MSAQTSLRSVNDQEVPAKGPIVDAHCVPIRPAQAFESKQGHKVLEGVCAESSGARALCLHVISIPPGGRARAHLHRDHETAVYMLQGDVICWYGERLRHSFRISQGEMVYIPAGVPHLPINASADTPVSCVVARTDPNEQESVELLPELDDLPHVRSWAGASA